MALSANGQWDIDGLLLGPGTKYGVETVLGLGVPDPKPADRDRPSRDGGWAGQDLMGPREVIFQVNIDGDPDESSYSTLIEDLTEVWQPRQSDIIATFRRFGRERRLYARPRGLILPWDDDFLMGAGRVAARLWSPDPVVYSEEEAEETGSGTFTVSNDGNYPVWPVITITGPGGTVSLANATAGAGAVSLVGLGGTATVDFDRRTVIQGGLDVYSVVGPAPFWWRLLPGDNSITVTGATSITVTYRHGWTSG